MMMGARDIKKIIDGIPQTAKAPVDLLIFGGFAIYVEGGIDG